MTAKQDKDRLSPDYPQHALNPLPCTHPQRSYLSAYPHKAAGEKQDKDRLLPDDRFIRLKEVMAITGRSKTSIYDDLDFPKPIKLSKRESAWVEREIRQWMQFRVDVTRGKAG